ncbi:transcriptional regulator, TetR family [Pseudonocardia thermophila]|mgnify:CR=1 FL=1|jgi:Transcriptional regulator|uniref:Transcriptional regulator, TetR family n=1 Tax=Pseudonocardia thermophila TaxID=1848 RepID=A0A1M6TWT7_PSETH|nr:helix-turn-helix domain-containing protein [Pseudonocardia thermophila]SHK61505.1 transcriptional regulator, TetR family [Pseudonocardia thermophila]
MTTTDKAGSADESLGAQVRAARRTKGFTQRLLAHAIGVSAATLSQIENGQTGLSVSRLALIADALGLTVQEILDIVVEPGSLPSVRQAEEPRPAPRAEKTPAVPEITHWRHYEPLNFDPVLRAALDEILEIGYHGATVRGIAARCGLSVSGIYHYYTSKQQMLLTILDLTMTELLARARAARNEGRDPVERFSLLIEHLALFHTHRRELGFVGASEMRSFDAGNRRKIAQLRTIQQRMVDHEVEAAVRQGRFRTDHPHEAARAAVTMCTALPTWWRSDGPLSPEQVAEQYVSFALDLMRFDR